MFYGLPLPRWRRNPWFDVRRHSPNELQSSF
jgi:hypothetical protein